MFKATRYIPTLYRLFSVHTLDIPNGFWWLAEGKLAALARPKYRSDFEFLKDKGVTHLVSLSKEVPDFHGVEISSVHMPIEGGGMPTVEQAKQFIDVVNDVNNQGWAVALHCGEGQGRASIMLACYTVWANDCTAEQAIKEVKEKRPSAVGTKERETRVKEFETMLKQSEK